MVKRLQRLWSGNGLWALIDQAALSAGTFLASVALARTLSPSDYGIFALAFSVVVICNTIQNAVVIYPLTLEYAGVDRDRLRGGLGNSLLHSIFLSILLGIPIFAIAAAMGGRALGFSSAILVVAWQLQEVGRRGLLVQLRHRSAVPGDLLAYVAPAIAIFMVPRQMRTASTMFLVQAAFFVIAWIVQTIQFRPLITRVSEIPRFARAAWKTGRWVLLSTTVFGLVTISYSWVLALSHSESFVAELVSVYNLQKATHPLMLGMSTFLIPIVVIESRGAGFWSGARKGWRTGLAFWTLLFPYYFALLFWPSVVLGLFYGFDSPYAVLTFEVRLATIAYMFVYLAQIGEYILNGLDASRHVFIGQVVSNTAGSIIGVPLTLTYGVVGALVWILLCAIFRFTANVLCLYVAGRQHREIQVSRQVDDAGLLPSTQG